LNIYLVVACMSLVIVLAVIALVREARLRRALLSVTTFWSFQREFSRECLNRSPERT
jgi:hypothetical protein